MGAIIVKHMCIYNMISFIFSITIFRYSTFFQRSTFSFPFFPHLLTQYLHHQPKNLGIITLVKQTYIKKDLLVLLHARVRPPILFAKCTTNYFTGVFYFLLPQPFPLLFGFFYIHKTLENIVYLNKS